MGSEINVHSKFFKNTEYKNGFKMIRHVKTKRE